MRGTPTDIKRRRRQRRREGKRRCGEGKEKDEKWGLGEKRKGWEWKREEGMCKRNGNGYKGMTY